VEEEADRRRRLSEEEEAERCLGWELWRRREVCYELGEEGAVAAGRESHVEEGQLG
jgi:sugar/nucleoside kinase (ribokinase family)